MADLPVATTPPAIGLVTRPTGARTVYPPTVDGELWPRPGASPSWRARRCAGVRRPGTVVGGLTHRERNHTNDSDDMTYPDGYTHMYALRTENRWLAPSTGRS